MSGAAPAQPWRRKDELIETIRSDREAFDVVLARVPAARLTDAGSGEASGP